MPGAVGRGILRWFLLLLGVVLYLWLYFLPAVVDINRSRRQAEDLERERQRMTLAFERATTMDEKENRRFDTIERRFCRRIPYRADTNVELRDFQPLGEHLGTVANRSALRGLLAVFDRTGASPWLARGQTDSRWLQDLREIFSDDPGVDPPTGREEGIFRPLFRYTKSRPLLLVYQSPLGSGFAALGEILKYPRFLVLDQFSVRADHPSPRFHVRLRILFRVSERCPNLQSGASRENGGDSMLIDFDSPWLMKPVYEINLFRDRGTVSKLSWDSLFFRQE